ncbi:MAG: hypothetical protein NTW21_08410 [Verrucomicrobia bacterium]|nr:hypothetical protein [Verrucomicrobiota bacterium]
MGDCAAWQDAEESNGQGCGQSRNNRKWDRGHIEIAGRKAKTAARRLVPLPENLKTWLSPWRGETGPIISITAHFLGWTLN